MRCERVFTALNGIGSEIDEYGCETAVAVITSAVSDSANGREFAQTVRDRYGLEPHVLSGDEEARMTFLGATSERDPPTSRRPSCSTSAGGRPSW